MWAPTGTPPAIAVSGVMAVNHYLPAGIVPHVASWPASRPRRGERPPMMAATAQPTAPRARAQRGLATWHTAPMIGEPMGVLPTRARDHRASTRPRSCGSEASWTVELPVVRNSTLAAPASAQATTAVHRRGRSQHRGNPTRCIAATRRDALMLAGVLGLLLAGTADIVVPGAEAASFACPGMVHAVSEAFVPMCGFPAGR
jgi:hypothetical protein